MLSLKTKNSYFITMYLLMLFLILSNYSVYFSLMPRFIYGICGCLLCIIISFCKLSLSFNDIKNLFVILIIIGTLILFGKSFIDLTFLTIVVILILSYFAIKTLIKKCGLNSIFKAYLDIIYVICLISIILYLLGTILNIVDYTSIISALDVNWGYYDYKNYYFIYFEGQYTNFLGNNILRNIGIFNEAPLFATLIVQALYINLFIIKKNLKKTIVLLIAIFSTFSSSAIAIGSILIFIDIYNRHLKNKKLIVLAPILAIFTLYISGVVLYDKLFTGNISGNIRIDDFIACFKSWQTALLIGNGFMNIDALAPFRAAWRVQNAGVSTGTGILLSNGGIILGIIYLYPFVIAIKNFVISKNKNIYGFIILNNVILLIMIVQYTALTMFFVALSWILTNKKFIFTN